MALSQLDQIKKFETGVEKIRQSVPMEAHDPSEAFTPKAAPPRAVVSAQPVMPKRTSAALNAGPAYSGGEQSPFGGAPSQPVPGAFKMPTVGGYYRDRREAAERASMPTPAGGRPAGASRRGGAAMQLDSTGAVPVAVPTPNAVPTPVAAPAGPVVNAVQNSGMPAGITRTLDAAGNPVYSGTGASVAAAGGPPQGSAVVVPQRTLPQTIAAPDNPIRNQSVGRQGAVIGNPGGAEAGIYGGEAERRLQNNISGLLFSPGNTRGKRALTGQAIEALTSNFNQARNAESQSALAGQNAEAAADLQAQRAIADANEAFAGRRFDASKFNVGVDLQARELEAKQRVPFEQQPILRSLDGGTSVLHRDGTLSALTNSDGTPFRVLDPSQRTTVSPDAEFKALTDELTAMSQFPGDGTEPRKEQIQARMAQLTGQGGPAKQVKRTGTLDGRRVVEYQDGTKAFLD